MMKATSLDQSRFDPTILGALRRFWPMVLVLALLCTAGSVLFTLVAPERYMAEATITVPPTSLAQAENSDQYLDSQVLLLESQGVVSRAVQIANTALHADVLASQDFSPQAKNLKIIPPEGASPGTYGSTLIRVSFTWPDATVAAAGTNAVLKAFDDARVATITADGEAAVAAIERAILDARTRGQRSDLVNKRTEILVNQQIDLARHPTFAWAAIPQVPINGNAKSAAAIGLLAGTALGCGLAYAGAARRRCLGDRLDPAAIYGAPLITELQAPRRRWKRAGWPAVLGSLPMADRSDSPSAEAYRFAGGYLERIRSVRGAPVMVAVVSTGAGGATRSSVVANLALAVAESGTSVLAVDANPAQADVLTALLLPGEQLESGFQQVLARQRPLSDCWRTSPIHSRLTVLGCGPQVTTRTSGAAYFSAVDEMMGKAKASFEVVLVDSPGPLQVADASTLLGTADVVIIVAALGEPVEEHVTLMERLKLVESDLVGDDYGQKPNQPWLAGYLWDRCPALAARRGEFAAIPSWQ